MSQKNPPPPDQNEGGGEGNFPLSLPVKKQSDMPKKFVWVSGQ